LAESAPPAPSRRKLSPLVLAAGAVGVAALTPVLLAAITWIRTPTIVIAPPRTESPRPATAVRAAEIAPPAPAVETAADPIGDGAVLSASARPAETPVMFTVEELVTRSMPAVVTVETKDGLGSGFFVSRELLVTNAHVVRGNSAVMLRASGTHPRTARVQTQSDDLDLAVLSVDIVDVNQVYLPLASPSDVHVGAEVIAIGSPLGLQNTVTRGIVSGMRQSDGVKLIQTDAAINPGNSGGPLLDRYGRVLGVNTMRIAGGGVQSLGFAVSIHYARAMLGAGFAPKSDDRRGDAGLREYNENVRLLAKRADAVEANWKKFRDSCDIEGAAPLVEREWFALWDGHLAPMRDSATCRSWQNYFKNAAVTTHDALKRYEAAGREAGLGVEQMRLIRRRHNLIWQMWDE
jgi:S1-C subfamily serine protease